MSTVLAIVSFLSFLIAVSSAAYSFVVGRRLLSRQKRAYDYAADVMAHAFLTEVSAHRVVTLWDTAGWPGVELGSPQWEAMVDAMDELRAAVEESRATPA